MSRNTIQTEKTQPSSIGAVGPDEASVEALKARIAQLEQENATLKIKRTKRVSDLKWKLCKGKTDTFVLFPMGWKMDSRKVKVYNDKRDSIIKMLDEQAAELLK